MKSASPLTLQFVARVERREPPTVPDVCAATARATLRLLDDERSQPGGEWFDDVSAWNGARIRKLVRRARGAAWERVQNLPGVNASIGSADVRAFVPGPRDDAPGSIRKLQITSPPLAVPDTHHETPSFPTGTLLIALAPDVPMSWGKQAAQAAHGAQRLADSAPPRAQAWLADPSIAVIHPCPVLWSRLADIDPVEIRDGGYTEIPAGTLTVRAWWQR